MIDAKEVLNTEEYKLLRDFYVEFVGIVKHATVTRHKGLEFIIHSNEQGHNRAHVHIRKQSNEIVIDLKTYKLLEKSKGFSPKEIKLARSFVKNNKELFINHWNDFTNGIQC